MQSTRIPHRDMIPVIAGHSGITSQLASRQSWQHEARVALVAARAAQDAGIAPEPGVSEGVPGNDSSGFGRIGAVIGGALIRFGTHLQGGAVAGARPLRKAL